MNRSRHLRRSFLVLAALATTSALAVPGDFGPQPPGALVREPLPFALSPVAPAPEPAMADNGSPIHFGANNPADQALAERVAGAIQQDPRLDGATVTVSANDGRVSLSGSARSPEQAGAAENAASRVAGRANVSGTLSPQGN